MNKREVAAIGLTVGRYGIAERMAKKVEKGNSIIPEMALFVAADMLDGIIARKMDADTKLRRTADAVVDRASVARVSMSAIKNNPTAKPYWAGIAVRELVVGAANLVHYSRTGEVTRGMGVHKLGTLSLVAFGLATAHGNQRLTHATGVTALAINGLLALDYVTNAKVGGNRTPEPDRIRVVNGGV